MAGGRRPTARETEENTMKALLAALCVACLSTPALAQEELQEVVVTGSRGEGAAIPGTSLKRPGDFILLTVEVSNDSRDEKTRREEIEATLRAMLAAASKDKSIELSVIGENKVA